MTSLYTVATDVSPTNNSHRIPRCFDSKLDNKTGSLINFDARDGGIPINFGLNCLGWMIIFILFCVIRRLVWDYGRLALIQKEDQGWTARFYGDIQSPQADTEDGELDKTPVEFPEVKKKGLFSWILVFIRVSDEHIRLKCGIDALQYIVFQKHLLVYTVIIFCLSIGIILPVNYSGTNEPDNNSFGATTVSNLKPTSSIFWLHTVFGIIYCVIMVVTLRHFSNLFAAESSDDSTKTIMITNIPKSVTADLIKQHFCEVYGEAQVLEVQLAYNFRKLKDAQRKVIAAQMGRHHCEELLQKTGERPLTTISTNKVSPCQCCGASHVDGIEYFTEEEEDGKMEVDQQRQKLKSLGMAFVTFENAKVVQRCLKDFNTVKHGSPESSVSRKIFSDHWNVKVAPLSGNIIWEHLSVDNESWWARALLINTLLFIFVLFLTTPTVILSSIQELEATIAEKNPKLAVPPNPFLTQFLPTILLWSFAAMLPAVVSWSSYFEAHWTRSKLEHSVMVKTYIFLLLMILILPSLALTSADALFHLTLGGKMPEFQSRLACVFLPNNGAFFVNYLITSALIGTALELCRFPELVSYAANMACARNEGEKRLARKEAVREFAYGQQYAWMLVIFSVMVVYCITCPLVTPFGLLYLALKHLTDRYNLYFNYRSPAYKYVDSTVHSTAVTFTMISTFFVLMSILFYAVIRLGIDDPQTMFALVVVIITIVLFVLRACFGMFKRFSPHKQPPSTDAELNGADIYIPEAYLPPVLQTTREMKATGSPDDLSPPQLTRRKNYGTTQNDHVIDASQLTPSSETVLMFVEDDKH